MIINLGRNDRCWCGSGKKYKHCHLGRERETPVTDEELLRVTRESYGREYCLHAQASTQVCNGRIIKAHTIQRSGGLSLIARSGHVYHFLSPETAAIRADTPDARLIGIGRASTFTGFCGFHDNHTFAPIENNPFQSVPEHAFLLTYRVLCKEIFLKRAVIEATAKRRAFDRGLSVDKQMHYQMALDQWDASVKAGLRELEHHKASYDTGLINGDFSEVRYCVVRFNEVPDFLCSGVLQPEYDFDGRVLQDLTDGDAILDGIGFSLIATDTGGAAVFSWLEESDPATKLISSLNRLDDVSIPDAITRFAFTFLENLFASPAWWDNLDDGIKEALIRRTRMGIQDMGQIARTCLADDGLRQVGWTVAARETNIDFE